MSKFDLSIRVPFANNILTQNSQKLKIEEEEW